MSDFPKEKYVDLENNPYLLGRITVHHVKEHYHAEVDIIHKESHKIFKHIDIIYHQSEADEAFISGIQRIRLFLDSLEQPEETSDDDGPLH